VAALQ